MYFLLCYGKNEFACKLSDDLDLAQDLAEWLLKHDLYDRVVLAEYVAECIVEEED